VLAATIGGVVVTETVYAIPGLGSLTVAPDGSSVALACVDSAGGLVTATLARDGSLTIAPRCAGGSSDPAYCSEAAAAVAAAGGAASAALSAVVAGLPAWADAALAAADARAGSVAPDGAVIFASPSGVFRITEGGAPTLLTDASFNSSRSLQPGLLHVSAAGDVFVVGRPPAGWLLDDGTCGGGGAGVYRFRLAGASAACMGRLVPMAKVFMSLGRALTAQPGSSDGALFVTTDSELLMCGFDNGDGASSAAVPCREVASVTSIMGARFVFRGLAALPRGA
jgi:hypothetical protein